MASFPGAKVHRVSRRKLGRGQHVQVPAATVVVTSAADTATLTFNQPVVVSGAVNLNVSGGVTVVSQTIVSSTVVQILYSGPLTTLTWSIGGSEPVATFAGGGLAPASGTFS